MEKDGVSKVYVQSKWSSHDPKETDGISFTTDEAVLYYPVVNGGDFDSRPRVQYATPQSSPTIENGGMDIYVTNASECIPLGFGAMWRRGTDTEPETFAFLSDDEEGRTVWAEVPADSIPPRRAWYEVARVAPHVSGVAVGDVVDVTGLGLTTPEGLERLVTELESKAGHTDPDSGPGLTIFTA